jgi:hypothetical protein
MEGIRTKSNNPEDAYKQLFPQDGVSVGAGAIYAIFLLAVFASIVIVCQIVKMLKHTTCLKTAWSFVTKDMYTQFVGDWQKKNPNSNPPAQFDGLSGNYYIKAAGSVPIADSSNGDLFAFIAMVTGCIYVVLSILVIFAVFWAVRGKPTYIASVSALMLSLLWLASGSVFLAFFSMVRNSFGVNKSGQSYVEWFTETQLPQTATTSVQVPATDVSNVCAGSNLSLSDLNVIALSSVVPAMGLLVLFGILVFSARFTVKKEEN